MQKSAIILQQEREALAGSGLGRISSGISGVMVCMPFFALTTRPTILISVKFVFSSVLLIGLASIGIDSLQGFF